MSSIMRRRRGLKSAISILLSEGVGSNTHILSARRRSTPPRHARRDSGFVQSTDHMGWMTIHAPKLLTPEELASLIEVAVTAPVPQIPPAHFGKGLRRGPRTGWGPWGVWVLIGHRQDIPASMLPQKPHCVTASLWA